MELANIEKLIEKYLEATTTVEEEKFLREYFSQPNVASHLQEYKSLFQYFSVAKTEQFTAPIPLKPRKKHFYKWISVAAVAALLFGIYFAKIDSKSNVEVIEDPQVAYQETKKALQLIAQNFNKGKQGIAYLGEFEENKKQNF